MLHERARSWGQGDDLDTGYAARPFNDICRAKTRLPGVVQVLST